MQPHRVEEKVDEPRARELGPPDIVGRVEREVLGERCRELTRRAANTFGVNQRNIGRPVTVFVSAGPLKYDVDTLEPVPGQRDGNCGREFATNPRD